MTEENQKDNSAFDATLERVRQLYREGFDWGRAWGKARLEYRISEWPSAWGDDLQVLIYGDFEPPKEDLHIPALRITVHPNKIENTAIRSATCVLKATVEIDEKSVRALVDAGCRINILLGAYTLVNWGNGAGGWWSYVTHGLGDGAGTMLAHKDLDRAITGIVCLPTAVRQKVDAALYWVREPRNLLMEFHRNDLLRIYSAYWNAFECLVEAVNILHPQQKLSKSEKQARIDEFVQERGGCLTTSDIQECYQNIVNPGFVGKARHAFAECFGEESAIYIDDCFGLPNRQNRLYEIRNSIQHGDVDAEHPEELLRIESRLNRLWIIVWRIFERLVPFLAPIEVSPPDGSKDVRLTERLS
jgi:hypothetical protein